MSIRGHDQFDDFRKERKRQQAKHPIAGSPLTYDNKALRELEQVEAREVQDRRLTQEVHEFFASATRQAAGIVEKVALEAQQEAGVRVEQEMEAFLIDALARMNSFVVTVLNQRRTPVAEAKIEPRLANIVGDSLDEFRWEGTADVGDKHIGQDPFDTDVEEVRRLFRAEVGASAGDAAPPSVPIEEHLVAAMDAPPAAGEADARSDRDQSDDDESDRDAKAEPADAVRAPATSPRDEAAHASARLTAAPTPLTAPSPAAELDRFKAALKNLVLQGTMTRDEAKAAWQTRLKALRG